MDSEDSGGCGFLVVVVLCLLAAAFNHYHKDAPTGTSRGDHYHPADDREWEYTGRGHN